MGPLALLEVLAFQVLKVMMVSQGSPDFQVLVGHMVKKANLACKVLLESDLWLGRLKETREWPAHLVFLVKEGTQACPVLLGYEDLMGYQVHQDHQASKATQAFLGQLDHRDQKDPWERWVFQDRQGAKGRQGQQAARVSQDRPAFLEGRVRKATLDLEDLVRQVLQDQRVTQA